MVDFMQNIDNHEIVLCFYGYDFIDFLWVSAHEYDEGGMSILCTDYFFVSH
jgi:hypothetical protein